MHTALLHIHVLASYPGLRRVEGLAPGHEANTCIYSASRAYHSALAQVVPPAYIIAPVKIHAELEKVLLIHVTVC